MISGGIKRHALTGIQVPSSDFKAHSDEYAAANVCFSLLAWEVEERWRGVNIKAWGTKLV